MSVYPEELKCGCSSFVLELEKSPGFYTWKPLTSIGIGNLQDAIILLQQAGEWIGERCGVRDLPTVRMSGASYFFDQQLGEFRNVDDPNDRIGTERVL